MPAVFTRYPYTDPTERIEPLAVEAPWTTARATRNIEHPLLESSTTLFTLRPFAARSGEMRLRFATSTEAHAASDFFATPTEFRITPTDPPEAAARFVIVGGDLTVAQDVGSWLVTFRWKEAL